MSSDDEFERRLRDVLHDRQLSVTPAPDALERVHAGVRRRHQHRLLASGVAAIAVVAVAAGGVALRSSNGGSHPVAAPLMITASAAPTPEPTLSPTPQLSSAAVVAPTPSPLGPQLSIASFTAVGTDTYWVLGATPGCSAGCTGVERTTDGGKTFERVGVTNTKTALPALGGLTSSTVRDIRFADATHGWIYGGALLATTDAGDTWTPVTMPGLVVDLAAVHGTAWAVVQTSATAKTLSFALYRSNYLLAGSASAWQQVALPVQLSGDSPSLAVQGTTAYLLGGSDVITLPVSGAVSSSAGPCRAGLPGQLSAGASSAILWASCGGTTDAAVYVSADSGKTWKAVTTSTVSLSVGGISATTAILGRPSSPLAILHATGATSPVTEPTFAVAGFSFIGFTNATQGYAIAQQSVGGSELWRTLDGGHSWTTVSIVS
jgi:hypothetical protein